MGTSWNSKSRPFPQTRAPCLTTQSSLSSSTIPQQMIASGSLLGLAVGRGGGMEGRVWSGLATSQDCLHVKKNSIHKGGGEHKWREQVAQLARNKIWNSIAVSNFLLVLHITITPQASNHLGSFSTRERNNMDDLSAVPRVMSFQLLNEITKNFSADMKIGTGSFGNVYKGQHTDGEWIAVKLLHNYIPGLEDEQFEKEYHNLANLQHKNIVRLVGYSHETRREFLPYNGDLVLADITQRALCFEYMQNGSLEKFLTDESKERDWRTRYAIIKGICQGLKYLHEELQTPMYHLDLKPANVLLDENMVPKIADFGLSRLFRGEQSKFTKSDIGTRGYLPPEYIDACIISIKFDIFSLGVVHAYWKTKLQTTLVHALEPYSKQVKRCIEIALNCVDADRHKRPSIGEIINVLNETEIAIQVLGASMNHTGSSMNKINSDREREFLRYAKETLYYVHRGQGNTSFEINSDQEREFLRDAKETLDYVHRGQGNTSFETVERNYHGSTIMGLIGYPG
uniref:non-specific serine/threonine protein kinase n=1 Tax=Aegilops tauschii TaxID=37682 RepID=M8CJ62_AEGTA